MCEALGALFAILQVFLRTYWESSRGSNMCSNMFKPQTCPRLFNKLRPCSLDQPGTLGKHVKIEIMQHPFGPFSVEQLVRQVFHEWSIPHVLCIFHKVSILPMSTALRDECNIEPMLKLSQLHSRPSRSRNPRESACLPDVSKPRTQVLPTWRNMATAFTNMAIWFLAASEKKPPKLQEITNKRSKRVLQFSNLGFQGGNLLPKSHPNFEHLGSKDIQSPVAMNEVKTRDFINACWHIPAQRPNVRSSLVKRPHAASTWQAAIGIGIATGMAHMPHNDNNHNRNDNHNHNNDNKKKKKHPANRQTGELCGAGQGLIRARKSGSHVHTKQFFITLDHQRTQIWIKCTHTHEATLTCTHKWYHMYTHMGSHVHTNDLLLSNHDKISNGDGLRVVGGYLRHEKSHLRHDRNYSKKNSLATRQQVL